MNYIQIHIKVVNDIKITTFVDENGNVSTVETTVEIVHLNVDTEHLTAMEMTEIYDFSDV